MQPNRSKTALLAGATGLVGGYVLQILLAHPNISQILVITRRPLTQQHDKLQTIIADNNTLLQVEAALRADMVFCCLGTTIKKAGNQDNFYRIDHDYPVQLATLARAHGATHFALISAIGANANSRIFYNKVKGETERDVIALGYEQCHIVRPSLILGERMEKRFGEDIMKKFSSILNPLLIGKAQKYRAIHAKTIAQAMVDKMLNTSITGTYIHENNHLLKQYNNKE